MKKILEIGGGRTPYFIRYKIPWETSDEYISVDVDEKNLNMAKESMDRHLMRNNMVPIDPNFVLSDASDLNIESETVDEVVVSNTLSAPIHHNWDRDGSKVKINNATTPIERIIKTEDDPEDPFYLERKNLIKEILRVVKPGGKISIYTDLIIYGAHSYERILNELKNLENFKYTSNQEEASRIDAINIAKLNSKEFCCCFRAEVLPKSEVHMFTRIR